MFKTILGSAQVNLGENTEINKQSHVKFWLNWIKYGAVSYSLSCTVVKQSQSKFWRKKIIHIYIYEMYYHVVEKFELKLLCLKINSRIGPIPCWESVKCKQWKNNNIQVATARKMSKCQLSMKCLLHQTNDASGNTQCWFLQFIFQFYKCQFVKTLSRVQCVRI